MWKLVHQLQPNSTMWRAHTWSCAAAEETKTHAWAVTSKQRQYTPAAAAAAAATAAAAALMCTFLTAASHMFAEQLCCSSTFPAFSLLSLSLCSCCCQCYAVHMSLQNDLEFLRVRSAKHELMVAPSKSCAWHLQIILLQVSICKQQAAAAAVHETLILAETQTQRNYLAAELTMLPCFEGRTHAQLFCITAEGDYVLIVMQDAAA
jgi:hypothetical protein